MNIQQIDYILAVDRLKNFSQAAEDCYITQSTLSTMIARFEDEIGITIFDRKTKPISTTREGELVIRQLKIIAKEIDRLGEVVDGLKGQLSGVLNIGVIPTVAPYLLPLFLDEFIRQFPQLHFVIQEATTEKIVEQLENRSLDIGIVSTPLHRPDLVEFPLYNEPFLLLDRADDRPMAQCRLQNIDLNRLWLLEEGHCMRTQVESICGLREKCTTTRNLDYKSGAIDSLMKFVNKNQGITLLPYLATLDVPTDEQCYLKCFEPPVPVRAIGLIVHRHFVKQSILDRLQAEIRRVTAPLLGANHVDDRLIISPLH